MSGSLINFAHRIRQCIETESQKISPDNKLIALLADAARLGWEQIDWMKVPVKDKERIRSGN
jgi:hypothetical protein